MIKILKAPQTLDCDNLKYLIGAKVIDHCHVTGKYTPPAHRDCNLNGSLVYKKLFTTKSFDVHLIKKELGKFDLKVNVKPKILEKHKKHMSFSIGNKKVFIDDLSSLLDIFVKNLGENGCKNLGKELKY